MVSKFKLDSTKSAATKEAITRTLEIANSYAGELSIEVLPLSKVELDPENNRELVLTLEDALNGISKNDPEFERKKQDWNSLESLAKTIKDDQLINPIYVYRFGNKCRLIAGERRTLASAIAGKQEIIARIASQRPIGTKLKILQWIENNERSDLSLAERISSIEAIIHEYKKENPQSREKITGQLLSNLTGMSETQSRRYLLILQGKPEIRKAIESGKIENIKMIELICSIKNEEHHEILLQSAISGLSFEELIRIKKELESTTKRKKKNLGRKKTNISLGSVKPNVVKVLISALMTSNILEENILKSMKQVFEQYKWDDVEQTEKGFKKIVALIEQGAAT